MEYMVEKGAELAFAWYSWPSASGDKESVGAEGPLYCAILHKGLEHSQTLVSASILEPRDNCILLCHLTCYNDHSFLLCLEWKS